VYPFPAKMKSLGRMAVPFLGLISIVILVRLDGLLLATEGRISFFSHTTANCEDADWMKGLVRRPRVLRVSGLTSGKQMEVLPTSDCLLSCPGPGDSPVSRYAGNYHPRALKRDFCEIRDP